MSARASYRNSAPSTRVATTASDPEPVQGSGGTGASEQARSKASLQAGHVVHHAHQAVRFRVARKLQTQGKKCRPEFRRCSSTA